MAEDYKGVVIAPSFPHLSAVGAVLKNATLGAQDVFFEDGGAYTGEVSVSQLKNLKVDYIIIGHSERRAMGETDKMVNAKVGKALGANINVVLCVGEKVGIRREGVASARSYVHNKLRKALDGVPSGLLRNVIVAYEPIWAISTSKSGHADTPEQSVQIIKSLKTTLSNVYGIRNPKVIYGGSVNAKNAKEFLSEDSIDGALVGGASLRPKEFNKILKIADSL